MYIDDVYENNKIIIFREINKRIAIKKIVNFNLKKLVI